MEIDEQRYGWIEIELMRNGAVDDDQPMFGKGHTCNLHLAGTAARFVIDFDRLDQEVGKDRTICFQSCACTALKHEMGANLCHVESLTRPRQFRQSGC